MKEANILTRGGRVIAERLPSGWIQRVSFDRASRRGQSDGVLTIVSPDGVECHMAVDAKPRLFPRDVPDVKRRLKTFEEEAVLVMRGFLTLSAKRRLTEEGLNYVDLTGNVRLVLSRPGLFIETQGATIDPNPVEKAGRSLRGAKAGRVVRALCDFPPSLTVSDLAIRAGVDISYASRLLEWLSKEGLLTRVRRRGVETVDRARLIRRWADDYSVFKSNEARSFLDPRGIGNLLRRLPTSSLRYAVTGSLAANRLAPVAPARLALVYVDDPDEAGNELNLRATEAGANTMLLVPFDEVVFDRTRLDESVTYVAPSQTAVDLLTGVGRSPSEGEAVLEWLERNPPS
jgi:hypothetical protein